MHPFRKVGEAGDVDAVTGLPAENIAFTSPVAFKPYPAEAITAALAHGGSQVFEDFGHIREIANLGGRDHAFVFTATVDGKRLTGGAFPHFDENGGIDDFVVDDFVVMVHPFSAAKARAEARGAKSDGIT
ncbi:nuclear transport factor 2 family protein [Streptomyces sp. NPDC039016]|uniref:nuclear transport factor 2 family protein n=1 Tax=Streptomyces sp. NPDC039016 TaxID=3154330 RepID=UPI003406439F